MGERSSLTQGLCAKGRGLLKRRLNTVCFANGFAIGSRYLELKGKSFSEVGVWRRGGGGWGSFIYNHLVFEVEINQWWTFINRLGSLQWCPSEKSNNSIDMPILYWPKYQLVQVSKSTWNNALRKAGSVINTCSCSVGGSSKVALRALAAHTAVA